MDLGFTRDHFDLLKRWGNHHFDAKNAAQHAAVDKLKAAYRTTEAWAGALKDSLFPFGRVKIRKAVINQGQAFSPYNWAKIYPSPDAPEALAYTVGIDTNGFVVKIDTVGDPPQRNRYLELRGDSNVHSPFGKVLPIEEGLQFSIEDLVEWSVGAIRNFAIGYDELGALLGMTLPTVTLVRDLDASRDAFAVWRDALLDGATRRGPLYWLPEGGIVIKSGKSGREPYDDQMELGVDPTGVSWAVQINEPRIPGDHNSLSAIGIGANGERLLLRQGFLRPDGRDGPIISGDEFLQRTGLTPIAVKAAGPLALRQWFSVCSLDVTAEEIRFKTSSFVNLCAAARAAADAGEAPITLGEALFGGAESDRHYRVGSRPAEEEREIRRRHGSVWLALAELLSQAGLRVRKGRHPLGYEIDAEVDGASTSPLLIEIKTGSAAGDIHTGVGQLHLYPMLIDRLRSHKRILLLPRRPRADVERAVTNCGIDIHTFELRDSYDGDCSVAFSPAFLRYCGISLPD